MSQLDNFLYMLRTSNIDFDLREADVAEGKGTMVTIRAGTGPNNLGYSGFATQLLFDNSEILVSVDIGS